MIVTKAELVRWLDEQKVTDYTLPTAKIDLIVDSPYFGAYRIVFLYTLHGTRKYQIRDLDPIPTAR